MSLVNDILTAFSHEPKLRDMLAAIQAKQSISLSGLGGSANAFLMTALQHQQKIPFYCIFESGTQAQNFFEDLTALLSTVPVVYFPALNNKLWNELGPPPTEVGQRIHALKTLLQHQSTIFITTAVALMEKIADPEDVELYTLSLSVGQSIQFDMFVKQLVEMGFSREERVDSPGEMSVRGGIVDVFLFEAEHPFRLEFWGDEVASIRTFDVQTQKSFEQCDSVEILPLGCAGPYAPIDERTIIDLDLNKTLFEYIADHAVLWLENPSLIFSALRDHQRQAVLHFESLSYENEYNNFSFNDYYVDVEYVERFIETKVLIKNEPFVQATENAMHWDIKSNDHYSGNLKLFRQHCERTLSTTQSAQLCLACDSDMQRDRMKDLFAEEGFPQSIHIFTKNLSEGFSWPQKQLYLFTTRELYSRVRALKPSSLEKRTVSFREQLSIKKGDYVVHTDYGIGIFEGLDKIRAYGKIRECLTLSYQDGDKLYVPLEKMDQVQKYSSSEGTIPTLSKLGSALWQNLKKRTKKRMREITEDLIKLYATRKMRPGFSFSEDTVWQKELEASFQFEETIDQMSAISDVKKDMQKSQPMDRLICGDVGYGKTEVAVRAAFKAINDGKQVAVLVPTTILAEQHFATFSERLSQFPIKMQVISRFKTPKQQRMILNELANGELDLLVGTHRLLSKDIKFKDLGLLIVDEEQRFGVIHKEKLKLLKQSVDTLTLSATPIPRTMHMALMGAKDMSIINSPPQNRHPIKTEVSRFDGELIREAILRELDRGGQVFFVHNRVQSIHGMSAQLNEIVPEAKVAVAHGRMRGHELEKVMLRFIRGEVQVLVCTMIIESGIDMPNANTLIINRADRLGLAQMYQLRGRVGRSDQQAYAYLLIPPMRKLTRDAIKRLQTIQEYSELGSGYKIAMRDLEIRGAGNVFGAEQTGFVNALGYELYTKIIQETISEIRQDLKLEDDVAEHDDGFEAKVECAVDAYIPDNYITSQAERVDLYRRLVKARRMSNIDDIGEELEDRFGAPPQHVVDLMDYLRIKILAGQLRLEKLRISKSSIEGEFEFASLPQADEFRDWLGRIVTHAPDKFELQQSEDRFGFTMNLPKGESNLIGAKKFLQSIA